MNSTSSSAAVARLDAATPTTAFAGAEVAFAAFGEAAASFQRSRTVPFSVSEMVARLRHAIEAADLWILGEIDPQALLSRGGYAIGAARQILFFHPRFMARILAADPAALLEAPLKFAIIEHSDGTALRWIEPIVAFSRYGNAALGDLGRELSGVCEEIADASLRPERAAD